MILAGDIGGTSTRLGLFEAAANGRPRALKTRVVTTLDFDGLPSMLTAFFEGAATDPTAVDRACFGVAGPVIGGVAKLTNVPWRIDADLVRRTFRFGRASLLNDLQAMAHAIRVLEDRELHTLQVGQSLPGGNMALIAAGTGLGVALLHSVDGMFIPVATESGHADYAARTERDIALLRDLTARYGRAEVEHVVSGQGLVNVHRVTHQAPCDAGVDLRAVDAPAAISTAALERRCAGCVAALELFVEAYGAETGNLALQALATGGVYVGGGVAPKILPALTTGAFMSAFRAKGSFKTLLGTIPVKVILNAEAGLLGAAVFAASAPLSS
jgi:glucokinase